MGQGPGWWEAYLSQARKRVSEPFTYWRHWPPGTAPLSPELPLATKHNVGGAFKGPIVSPSPRV